MVVSFLKGISLGQFFSIIGEWIFKAFLQPVPSFTHSSSSSFLPFLFLFTSEVPGVEFDSLPDSIITWAGNHWRPKIPFRVNMLCLKMDCLECFHSKMEVLLLLVMGSQLCILYSYFSISNKNCFNITNTTLGTES